jgi:hypothetical protein
VATVAQKKANAEASVKQAHDEYQSMGEAQDSMTTEKYYLDQMSALFQQMSGPDAEKRWPEIAQKAVALGLLTPKDASSYKSLSDAQAAINLGSRAVIQNIKDTANSPGGGQPMRIFGSEVNAQLETAMDPSLNPEARYKILTTASGLVNKKLDAINSYNSPVIGGLGNRLNGGDTMLPSEWMQQFNKNHDTENYRKLAVANTPAFPGMTGYKAPVSPSSAANNDSGMIRVIGPKGQSGSLHPAELQDALKHGWKKAQ